MGAVGDTSAHHHKRLEADSFHLYNKAPHHPENHPFAPHSQHGMDALAVVEASSGVQVEAADMT